MSEGRSPKAWIVTTEPPRRRRRPSLRATPRARPSPEPGVTTMQTDRHRTGMSRRAAIHVPPAFVAPPPVLGGRERGGARRPRTNDPVRTPEGAGPDSLVAANVFRYTWGQSWARRERGPLRVPPHRGAD